MFAAGDPCSTDKAVPIETVDAVTERSLVVACPQLSRAWISLMSCDLMVSTFPVSQKTMFLNLMSKKGAGSKSIVVLKVLKALLALQAVNWIGTLLPSRCVCSLEKRDQRYDILLC